MIRIVSLVSVLALALAACGGQSDSQYETSQKHAAELSAQDQVEYDQFLKGYVEGDDAYAPDDLSVDGLALAGWCATYPNACFVNYAYSVLLGRSAFGDPGHIGWVEALRNGSLNRPQVWYSIRHSAEGCARLGC